MRKAFTLVEVLVALVVFSLGMLGLAATSAVAARDLATANRRMRAQLTARNRVEQLRVTVCTQPSAGSARMGTDREFWRVDASASAVRVITDSVDFALPRGRRDRVVARAWVICA